MRWGDDIDIKQTEEKIPVLQRQFHII